MTINARIQELEAALAEHAEAWRSSRDDNYSWLNGLVRAANERIGKARDDLDQALQINTAGFLGNDQVLRLARGRLNQA